MGVARQACRSSVLAERARQTPSYGYASGGARSMRAIEDRRACLLGEKNMRDSLKLLWQRDERSALRLGKRRTSAFVPEGQALNL